MFQDDTRLCVTHNTTVWSVVCVCVKMTANAFVRGRRVPRVLFILVWKEIVIRRMHQISAERPSSRFLRAPVCVEAQPKCRDYIYTFPHCSSLPFSLLNCDCPASATLRILSPLPKGTNEFVCIQSLSSEVKRHFADLTWWNKLHESISIFVLLNFTSWSASSKHSFPPPLHVWPPIRTTTHKYPAIVWCSALFRAWVTVKKK